LDQQSQYQFLDRDFPSALGYFKDLLGRDRVKNIVKTGQSSATPHFWYPYLKAVGKWERDGADFAMSTRYPRLIELGSHITHIRLFEKDWGGEPQRSEFMHRLRTSRMVAGLLFELRAGFHFLNRGLSVKWVANTGDQKVPDLEIAADGSRVIVECTCKQPHIRRRLWDKKLVEDMLKSASDKLDSSTDWGCPRLVAVRVPEEVRWAEGQIKKLFDQQLSAWVHEGRMRYVNVAYFMGHEDPRPVTAAGRVRYYDTSNRVFLFNNPMAYYSLPISVALALG